MDVDTYTCLKKYIRVKIKRSFSDEMVENKTFYFLPSLYNILDFVIYFLLCILNSIIPFSIISSLSNISYFPIVIFNNIIGY